MCNVKIFSVLLLVVAPWVAAAKGGIAAAPVKSGFAGVGSVLQDDFAIMEDEFEAPTATLTFEAAFEELTSSSSFSSSPVPKDATSDEPGEKPFLFTLLIDLLILAVVAHGFRRYREEYMNAKKPASDVPEEAPQQANSSVADNSRSASCFQDFARAVQTGDEAACLRLLESHHAPELRRASDACGCSALHLAAHSGCLNVLEKLVELGSDANAVDMWDETPLHFAARAGQVEACRTLLAAGSKLGAKNGSDHPALLVAAEAKQEATCRFLLDEGATAGDVADADLPPLFSMLMFERMLLGAEKEKSEKTD